MEEHPGTYRLGHPVYATYCLFSTKRLTFPSACLVSSGVCGHSVTGLRPEAIGTYGDTAGAISSYHGRGLQNYKLVT
jgi:hypothetical protein